MAVSGTPYPDANVTAPTATQASPHATRQAAPALAVELIVSIKQMDNVNDLITLIVDFIS
jgi:hypothetical protein